MDISCKSRRRNVGSFQKRLAMLVELSNTLQHDTDLLPIKSFRYFHINSLGERDDRVIVSTFMSSVFARTLPFNPGIHSLWVSQPSLVSDC